MRRLDAAFVGVQTGDIGNTFQHIDLGGKRVRINMFLCVLSVLGGEKKVQWTNHALGNRIQIE